MSETRSREIKPLSAFFYAGIRHFFGEMMQICKIVS